VIIQGRVIRHVTGHVGSGKMRIEEVLTEADKQGWLGKAWDTVLHGRKDPLVPWVRKHIRSKGTQWIYRNVDKQFPKRYVKSDVKSAIGQVLGTGA